jgi:hypothetical protein
MFESLNISKSRSGREVRTSFGSSKNPRSTRKQSPACRSCPQRRSCTVDHWIEQ